jgi:gliding motility-associatede transport system auxiliary component
VAEISKPSRRKLIESGTLGAGVVLAALLLGLVNYFGWKYYERFDWTKTKLYTLSEKSINVAKALDKDVDAVVFTSANAPLADEVQELLARYQALTPHVKVRIVDPVKNLAEAQTLLQQFDTRYVEGSVKVVFASGKDRRIFEEKDLADYDYSNMQFGGQPEVEAFKGEEAFTGALVELSSGKRPKVLFTTGHGERKLDGAGADGLRGAQELLGRDNVDMEPWGSLGQPAVPAGTDLVVVAGPTSPFAPPELQAFSDYLDHGGRMLWLIDPTLRQDGSLVDLGVGPWLAGYGVQLDDDIVIDPDRGVPFFGAETFFADSYGSHPAVKALSQAGLQVIFALARSVKPAADVGDHKVTELVKTTGAAWGETNLAGLPKVEKDDQDLAGPLAVAVAVEAKGAATDKGAAAEDEGTEEGEGDDPAAADAGGEGAEGAAAKPASASPGAAMRLAVVGDSDFAADRLLPSAADATLLDNVFNWLLARHTLLGIPPKKPEQVRLSLSDQQLIHLYLIIALLPLAAIVGGVVVWMRRRR